MSLATQPAFVLVEKDDFSQMPNFSLEFADADAQDERDRQIAAEIDRAQTIADFGNMAPVTPPLALPPSEEYQREAQSSRKRLRSKQPAPFYGIQQEVLDNVVNMAQAAECTPLPEDARRQHIHWTHVRTKRTSDKQPESFSRRQFWEHLLRVYKEVYPDPDSPTGSILQFGSVVKERHLKCNILGARSLLIRPVLLALFGK